MSMKNSNDTIGNRTRDLPVCSDSSKYIKNSYIHIDLLHVSANHVAILLLLFPRFIMVIMIIAIITIYLTCIWVTLWSVPFSHTRKSLEFPALVFSAFWPVVLREVKYEGWIHKRLNCWSVRANPRIQWQSDYVTVKNIYEYNSWTRNVVINAIRTKKFTQFC